MIGSLDPNAPIFAACVVLVLSGCTVDVGTDESVMAEREASIQEVQEAHTPEWMAVPGVVGTGIGLCDAEPCIRVFVTRLTEEIEREIPAEVEGYRVRIEVTGEVRARDTTGG